MEKNDNIAKSKQSVRESSDIRNQKHRRKRIVTPTIYSLPHPNMKFDQHLKLIKAYVIVTNKGAKGVMYKDVSSLVDFSPVYISGTNKFLEELGILEGRHGSGYYAPTQSAIEFQNYKDWENEGKAKETLRNLVEKSWFWKSTMQLLEMKGRISTKSELIQKLGADSQADPSKHNLCFRHILDYLKYTELIKVDREGNLSMASELTQKEPQEPTEMESIEEELQGTTGVRAYEEGKPRFEEYRSSEILVKVVPTKKNIDKIKAFLDIVSLGVDENEMEDV